MKPHRQDRAAVGALSFGVLLRRYFFPSLITTQLGILRG